MLRYFRIKLFPNITTLLYRSQLHVPLYVSNRGWGSRYRGLGILTPTPDFCFWNYKNFSFQEMLKYRIKLFPNITTLFYRSQLHFMSGIEGGGEDTVAWASWPPSQIYVFEIMRNSVICPIRTQIFLACISPVVFQHNHFNLSVTVTYSTACQEFRVGVWRFRVWASWPQSCIPDRLCD